MRVAVLGANGQVGAEVCLILRNHDVELVPIARNRFGSAFLRYHGVACRHGLPADPAEARRLVGDCQLVVNLALATVPGRPAEARRINRRLIENAVAASAPGARFVHCSTMNVYGDPRPGGGVRWRSPYGREKLAGERDARRAGRRWRKPVFVLRLGHVCGEHQNITGHVRRRVADGTVVLPAVDGPSNTVFTATIVDAILRIAADAERPGTYDLFNRPQWTWHEVFAFEARRTGIELRAERLAATNSGGGAVGPRRVLRRVDARALSRHFAVRAVARLPLAWNRRIQALFYRSRAAAEIAALDPPRELMEGMLWSHHATRTLNGLTETRRLLESPAYAVAPLDPSRAWPLDLGSAEA